MRVTGHTIEEIARAIGGTVAGDTSMRVTGASEPAQAGPDHLALAMDPKYAPGLAQGQARAALLWADADWQALGLKAAILIGRPRLAMSGLTQLFDPGPEIAPGIHPSAVIDPTASIGPGAAIGAFVVIGRDARIGANVRIASHVTIAEGVEIGADALIHTGARIGARVRVGDRFICQPGAVIGSDGFSFVTEKKSGVEQIRETLGERGEVTDQNWLRIHSLGTVEIGDDVEVGANCAIDRGTIRATRIGSGTKLDNLVHIAHNVTVGRDCLLCGQVGIAGSTRIGDRVVMGGQCGVGDNLFVGDDVIAGGATKIMSNAPAGRVLLGYPAIKMESHIDAWKNIRRLPRLFAQVAELRARSGAKDDGSDG
ncbi:UDP-3-O-(3-hydroxymyristoyl)glucosamine N-acyltransferase [Frigidibacter sp. RF13]|uniref:UDP-3-O-(3-hydroxymyristoyl)glucosamine N-acyltransferase n=1 Tax=Frigidibacter sp. RF13 TaxID=2997340 RepID=UPI00227214DF|nr:UDP-3-O-(3-hydroxymyristoyl)glucosamine N-acyltransferase [Frigidibacter sp. RF13]MCY1128567.1 UDP-3-O-(3-hydroxymyristoyl)glucosamine N-acyltransferase [Frigidibacter sp. RF13]